MFDGLNKLSFVSCRLVVLPHPRPLANEAPGIEKLSSRFTMWGKNIPQRTQVERKQKALLVFSIRKRLKETKAFFFGRHVFLCSVVNVALRS